MDLILPLPSFGGIIDNFPKDADPRQFAKETVQTLEELIAVNSSHGDSRFVVICTISASRSHIPVIGTRMCVGVAPTPAAT
jgi:hypothetical protein